MKIGNIKALKDLEIGTRKKMSPLFTVLSIISVAALLISNIVASKSISLFRWEIQGQSLSVAASFVVFPITYIISDIFSEVYGYAWSRKISWIAFFANLFMVVVFETVIALPGVDPVFSGKFSDVLGSSFGILVASLTAFMCGDLFNDKVFRIMKKSDYTNSDLAFAARSILSSLVGEIVDSMIFLPLLYLFIGGYGTIITSPLQLIAIIMMQGILKTVFEGIFCPLVIFIVRKVKVYEESFES